MRTLFIALLAAAGAAIVQTPRATLTGFAVMPADTFADGPPSGAWLGADGLGAAQFPSQPVQGISLLTPISGNEWLALSDNGYGTKLNSADYLLRIYRVAVDWDGAPAGRPPPAPSFNWRIPIDSFHFRLRARPRENGG